jgi:hypothetical protein
MTCANLLRRASRLAAAAIVFAPATPLHAQGSSERYQPPGRSSSTETCRPPQCPEHSGGNLAPLLIGAGLAGGLALLLHHEATAHTQSLSWDSEAVLDRDGPQLDEVVHPGEFEVEGYLRGGWPLVFNIDADPDASVILRIDVDGVDPKSVPAYRLTPLPAEEGDAAAHGWYARVDLPKLPFAGARRAKLRLSAIKDDRFVDLAVYGVGAGPEAVGSVGVTVDYFGPSPMIRGGEHADAEFQVRFHNQVQFPQLHAQITQQVKEKDGGYRRTTADTVDLLSLRQPLTAPIVKGAWPFPGHQFPGPGLYDMDVVANLTHGPWVIGFAPTPVQVQ